MSYIVPRKKPDRCTNCLFIDKITYDCKLMYDNDYPDFESQYANCPLIEIPTPHGRLIDADEMMMSLADWWYSSFGQEETDEAKAIRAVMQQVEKSIDEMTVIEAEGSEE